jgi:hypothetical protein
MIIIIHVILAISSIIATSLLALFPSVKKLRVNNILIGSTIASGFILVFTTHVRILNTCISGLFYLCAVLAGTAYAKYRLASQEVNIKNNN